MANYYNPQDRANEKKLQRQHDDLMLKSGKASSEEINRKNGLLSGLNVRKAFVGKRRLRIAF